MEESECVGPGVGRGAFAVGRDDRRVGAPVELDRIKRLEPTPDLGRPQHPTVEHITGMTVAALEEDRQRALGRNPPVEHMGRRAEEGLIVEILAVEYQTLVAARQIGVERLASIMPIGDIFERRPERIDRIIAAQPEREPPIGVVEQDRGREIGLLAPYPGVHVESLAFQRPDLGTALDIDGYQVEMTPEIGDAIRVGEVHLLEALAMNAVILLEIDQESTLTGGDGGLQIGADVERPHGSPDCKPGRHHKHQPPDPTSHPNPMTTINEPIDWNRIDTVLLDMDGTLLDLHFDNHFWLEHVPRRYGEARGLTFEAARAELLARYRDIAGTLEWYCVDHWSRELGLDLVLLKREVEHLIAVHPHVMEFLERLAALGKRRVLVTNAHQKTLALKLERTPLAGHLERVVCAHDLGIAKESPDFWPAFQAIEPCDPERTLFVDDNLDVLRAARKHGFRRLLAVLAPDSKQPPRQTDEFAAIRDFSALLPGLAAWTQSTISGA